LNSNFVLFRAERGDKIGDEVYKRFNIRATPTTLMLDKDGSEYDWHVGYGPPPEKFLETIEKSVKGIDTFKSISEAYAKDPKNIEAVFKLARKYDSKYEQEKAKELYKEVLALDPDGKKGTTDYQEEKVTFTEYAEFSIGAMSAFARKIDPTPLQAFIKKYPESPLKKSAYQYLSSYYGRQASKEEAQKFFEAYTSKYPDDPYVLRSYISRIIRDKDNIDKGIELAEKIKDVMKYNPDPRYQNYLAQLHMLKDNKEKADEVYGKRFMDRKVSRLTSGLMQYASFWVGQKENTESAQEMMELALKIYPDRWYNFRTAAQNYIRMGKEEKALKLFGPEYAAKHQNDADVLNSYAMFWAQQGKNLESALEAANKSVELQGAYYNWDSLATVYQKMKKHEKALKAAEKAYELADDQIKARYKAKLEQIKKAFEKEKEKK
jgi:tetratricopeptide (TPR) repeat protein